MERFITDLYSLKRRYRSVFPLSRIGFLFPCPIRPPATYTNKLELCLRLSSASPEAVDVIDGREYHTPFPHVILKLPGSVHTYQVETEREAVYLQYSPELEGAMREAGLLDIPRIWPAVITPELRTLFFRLRQLMDHLLEPGVIDRIDLVGMELFQMLIDQDSQRDRVPDEMESKIGRITSFFHLHFTEEIDLERLLRENGLSRRNFFRYWKKFHAEGPAEYLRELRLLHAASLLAETSLDTGEIARQVRLGNSSYLARLFRNRFGITPLGYRRGSD